MLAPLAENRSGMGVDRPDVFNTHVYNTHARRFGHAFWIIARRADGRIWDDSLPCEGGSRDWRLRHGWWASGKSATGSGKAGSARSFDRVCDIQCHEILQASFTRGCNEIDSALA